MVRRSSLALFLVCGLLAACESAEQPTQLDTPSGASDIKETRITDSNAHQTSFVLHARYPASPALAHYSKLLGKPWVRCDWIPQWQGFLDGTASPLRTVHQYAYVWVNAAARRTIVVAARYYSAESSSHEPDNELQQVMVIEYFKQDIQQEISRLKLQCPTSNAL